MRTTRERIMQDYLTIDAKLSSAPNEETLEYITVSEFRKRTGKGVPPCVKRFVQSMDKMGVIRYVPVEPGMYIGERQYVRVKKKL